ncbi:lipopolysaccharide biosynthesis protein [Frigidibacter sp. MR17.14]|uniref:lipopolysaccharide biosynthesis protein n=1 Tax=Frigidibacter sp. MR17.14 TaxID=3126509 RepID=UPI0030131999
MSGAELMLTGKALKGAIWLVLSRFLGKFIDFGTLIVLARILTPADFGLVALALILISVVDMVLEVPVLHALLRQQTMDKADLDTAFTLSLARGTAFAFFILAAAWPFAQFYEDDRLFSLLLLMSLGPFLRGLINPAMVVLAQKLSFRQTFTIEMGGKIAGTLAAIALVLSGSGYWAIASNSVVAAFVTTLGSYIIMPYRPSLTFARFSTFAGYAGWHTLSQIVAALNWQLDRFLLGRSVSQATLGTYVLASDMAGFPVQSVVSPAMQAATAAFSSINKDAERLKSAFLKASRFVMLVATPVCIGIFVTSDLAIRFVLGEKWLDAAPMLQLLAIAILPSAYLQILSAFCMASGQPSALFKIGSVELAIRLLIVPVAIHLMAVTGMLYARLLIAAPMFLFYMLTLRRLGGIGMRAQLGNLWPVALAAVAMAIAVTLLRNELEDLALAPVIELALCMIVGAATYGLVLRALGIRLPAKRFGLRYG